MTVALPLLLALQTCDQRIRQTVHTVATLRQALTTVQEEAENEGRGIQARRDTLVETEKIRSALTEQIDQIKTQLQEKRQALRRRRVKHTIETLQREVALLDARKVALEEELDTILARLSQDTATLRQAEALAPGRDEERQRAASTLLDKIAATDEALRIMQDERMVLTAGITPFLLHEYERIFLHRSGVAVVAIERETCQGCHLHVPVHICLELQRHPRLTFCPNCQRILFVSKEAPGASSSPNLPSSNGHQPHRPQRRTRGVTRASKAPLAVTPSQTPSMPA
jgi:predicted  nucleic acid-binding Zn-ribbon protein